MHTHDDELLRRETSISPTRYFHERMHFLVFFGLSVLVEGRSGCKFDRGVVSSGVFYVYSLC